MSEALDYIHWRGDLAFSERPFNEVDNLILTELIYYNFGEVCKDDESITIAEAYARHKALETPSVYDINDPVPMLEACAGSRRFGNIRVEYFVDHTDEAQQIQFAAALFHLGGRKAYVAYRGTDSTIVGWREDFNFSYMNETPAQAEAVCFLNMVLEKTDCEVIVGGHSKGGNLAIYAAVYSDPTYKKRILKIYSNDGPGFNQSVLEEPTYRELLPKMELLLPEGSVIGIIFANDAPRKIIRSMGSNGVEQHSPYNWIVERDTFSEADGQTSASKFLDETLDRWLQDIDQEDRKFFVETMFGTLEASGAKSIGELNANKLESYNAIMKAVHTQDPEIRESFFGMIKELANIGKDVMWDEAKKHFEPYLAEYEKKVQERKERREEWKAQRQKLRTLRRELHKHRLKTP